MRTHYLLLGVRMRRLWLGTVVLLLALLLFGLLAGCSQPTAQQVPGPNCPSPTLTTAWPSASTQVVRYNPPSSDPAPVTLQVAQTLEVDLYGPWSWSLRTLEVAPVLTLASPAGYGDTFGESCGWRFTAQQPGVDTLEFFGNGMCQGTAASCVGYQFKLAVTVTAGT